MTIEEAREILGEDFDALPKESITELINLIRAVATFVIASNVGPDNKHSG